MAILALIWLTVIWCYFWHWLSFLFCPQGLTFSFRGCLPSGWIILLLSGVITRISENVFLDRDNFWPTFMIHFSVGLACFCVSSYVMYVLVFLFFFYCFLRLLWSSVEYNCLFLLSLLLIYLSVCFFLGLLAIVGKNLSSKALFAFMITRTDDSCNLTVRWVLFLWNN